MSALACAAGRKCARRPPPTLPRSIARAVCTCMCHMPKVCAPPAAISHLARLRAVCTCAFNSKELRASAPPLNVLDSPGGHLPLPFLRSCHYSRRHLCRLHMFPDLRLPGPEDDGPARRQDPADGPHGRRLCIRSVDRSIEVHAAIKAEYSIERFTRPRMARSTTSPSA